MPLQEQDGSEAIAPSPSEVPMRTHRHKQAFLQILQARLPQVAVCTTDLQGTLQESFPAVAEEDSAPRSESVRTAHPRPTLAIPYVAPRTETEEALTGMWQDLLGVAPIGIKDNFFELGGHSLLAVQMISQLRTSFEVEMTVQSLFDLPTVATLAERIESMSGELGDLETMARLLERVELLSEGEVRALLEDGGPFDRKIMSTKFAREQSSLHQRIAGFSPERRTVLERLLRPKQRSDAGIQPRNRSLDPPPLTFAQEQLWFLDQLAPGNWFYNESSGLRFTFTVNTAVLQKALNEVAHRHETLHHLHPLARRTGPGDLAGDQCSLGGNRPHWPGSERARCPSTLSCY